MLWIGLPQPATAMEAHNEGRGDTDNQQKYANTGHEVPFTEALPTSSTNWEGHERQNDSSDESDKKPVRPKFTAHQKATFAGASLASFANMMAFAIISVFYPIEVREPSADPWRF